MANSHSAGRRQEVRRQQAAKSGSDYALAYDEWSNDEDSALWDSTAADGLADEDGS